MSAVLDRPPGLVPTIGGSTYVKPSEMDWKPTRFEKVSIKVLYEDPERGEMTCLLKLEPGAYIPFHKHPEIEQTLVLEGSVEDHDGMATAGDYVWRKPGSLHDHTPNDHCVRFAVVVTFHDATLVTRRALPLSRTGLSPAGPRQLRVAHRCAYYSAGFQSAPT
jgi:quercetin dioxygenase-like cupin family protein